MPQESNPLDKADLRANTLCNNLVWLKSFGCTIKREGKLVLVHHPRLREFTACMVIDNDAGNLVRLDVVLSEAALGQAAPDVYIDSEVKDGLIHRLLADKGFQPVLTSIITVGVVLPAKEVEGISLERATVSQRDLWCEIYYEGFGKKGETTVEDIVDRWSDTFVSEDVHNWLFVENGRQIGVCQSCTANGVVGLYSFTLLPSERGVNTVMSVIKALRAKLFRDGERVAYFERTQELRSRHRKVGFAAASLTGIREFTAYRRLP